MQTPGAQHPKVAPGHQTQVMAGQDQLGGIELADRSSSDDDNAGHVRTLGH